MQAVGRDRLIYYFMSPEGAECRVDLMFKFPILQPRYFTKQSCIQYIHFARGTGFVGGSG